MRVLEVAAAMAMMVALLLPPPARRPPLPAVVLTPPAPAPSRSTAVSIGASIVMAMAVALLLGDIGGVVAGAVVGVVSVIVLRRLQQRQHADDDEHLVGQLSVACDLMSALLSSGATPLAAANAVAEALGPPIAIPLREVAARLRLGAEPAAAWAPLATRDAGAPIAAAAVRAADSGAPLGDILRRVAVDLRRERRTALMARARVLGVRVVLPLGVCFLPAFLLVGVVPVVVTLIGHVLADSG